MDNVINFIEKMIGGYATKGTVGLAKSSKTASYLRYMPFLCFYIIDIYKIIEK